MKLKIKAAVITLLCLTFLAFATGCDVWDIPYDVNDTEGYTVSIKYDANGGLFQTGTTVIVDSYNIDALPKNSEGMAEIALIAPENEDRTEHFTVTRNGYFLVGWYDTREAAEKAENEFSYSGYWDFEKDRVQVDPAKEHTANKPQKTLYAAWLPLFTLEVYDIDTEKCVETISFNPLKDEFKVPQWDEKTGAVNMNSFTKRDGYTFNACYMDAAGEVKVEDGSLVAYPEVVDLETATTKNTTCKLYMEWQDGDWFRIETAEQFYKSAKPDGNYQILADLDFTEQSWPDTFTKNGFTGTIEGNGHVFRNISFNCSNNSSSAVSVALFASIAEGATVKDISFENATVTLISSIKGGSSCAIFAGSISENATISNLAVKNSSFVLGSRGSNGFGLAGQPEEYFFGLVCAMNDPDALGITYEGLKFTYADDYNYDNARKAYSITIDGNTVTLAETEKPSVDPV